MLKIKVETQQIEASALKNTLDGITTINDFAAKLRSGEISFDAITRLFGFKVPTIAFYLYHKPKLMLELINSNQISELKNFKYSTTDNNGLPYWFYLLASEDYSSKNAELPKIANASIALMISYQNKLAAWLKNHLEFSENKDHAAVIARVKQLLQNLLQLLIAQKRQETQEIDSSDSSQKLMLMLLMHRLNISTSVDANDEATDAERNEAEQLVKLPKLTKLLLSIEPSTINLEDLEKTLTFIAVRCSNEAMAFLLVAAKKLHPIKNEALSNDGTNFNRRGKAVILFKKISEITSVHLENFPALHFVFAEINRMENDSQRYISSLTFAVNNAKETCPDAYLALATLYKNMGKIELSVNYYTALLSMSKMPNCPQFINTSTNWDAIAKESEAFLKRAFSKEEKLDLDLKNKMIILYYCVLQKDIYFKAVLADASPSKISTLEILDGLLKLNYLPDIMKTYIYGVKERYAPIASNTISSTQ